MSKSTPQRRQLSLRLVAAPNTVQLHAVSVGVFIFPGTRRVCLYPPPTPFIFHITLSSVKLVSAYSMEQGKVPTSLGKRNAAFKKATMQASPRGLDEDSLLAWDALKAVKDEAPDTNDTHQGIELKRLARQVCGAHHSSIVPLPPICAIPFGRLVVHCFSLRPNCGALSLRLLFGFPFRFLPSPSP